MNYGDPKVCLLCGKSGVDPRIGMCEPRCRFEKRELYELAAVAVAVFLYACFASGCVSLGEAERREQKARCETYEQAIEVADKFSGNDAKDISWNLKGWKELECEGRGR